MHASFFTYDSKIFQPQQILFHWQHNEQKPHQLKRLSLTFEKILFLNFVHVAKTGKQFVAHDNSLSVQ